MMTLTGTTVAKDPLTNNNSSNSSSTAETSAPAGVAPGFDVGKAPHISINTSSTIVESAVAAKVPGSALINDEGPDALAPEPLHRDSTTPDGTPVPKDILDIDKRMHLMRGKNKDKQANMGTWAQVSAWAAIVAWEAYQAGKNEAYWAEEHAAGVSHMTPFYNDKGEITGYHCKDDDEEKTAEGGRKEAHDPSEWDDLYDAHCAEGGDFGGDGHDEDA
jgi:hypothetical protein